MRLPAAFSCVVLLGVPALAQQPPGGPPGGGGFSSERALLGQFDKDGDGRLDRSERTAARAFIKENPAPRRWGPPGGRGPGGRGNPGGPPGGPGGPGGPPGDSGPGEEREAPVPGAKISKDDVKPSSVADFYSADTLRTLFLDFENDDWESELEDFHNTDVEVPATLTVDGRTYPGVGVHFRGASSYMMVPAGKKRSLNVSLDFTQKGQRVSGYKTLNLNNNAGDASFLSASLYSRIARKYIPAPKVNFVRVVINGESWGVYGSQQQFNKDFIQENYRTSKGARWKVPGSPNGRGGLEYIGDDRAAYERIYEMKDGTTDDQEALIRLCKTLSETPLEELEPALAPMLDIDSTLWFLALDIALINSDGYWTRASDYTLYRDREGRFHLIPHDMNEAFRGSGGGPRGGGPQGGGGAGVALDPLSGLDDKSKPLRSRLLAVPALRERYLEKIRRIAEEDLDWKNLGPMVAAYRRVIGGEVAADTRKLGSTEQFEWMTSDTPAAEAPSAGRGRGGMPLRTFADERRAYLLSVTEVAAGE